MFKCHLFTIPPRAGVHHLQSAASCYRLFCNLPVVCERLDNVTKWQAQTTFKTSFELFGCSGSFVAEENPPGKTKTSIEISGCYYCCTFLSWVTFFETNFDKFRKPTAMQPNLTPAIRMINASSFFANCVESSTDLSTCVHSRPLLLRLQRRQTTSDEDSCCHCCLLGRISIFKFDVSGQASSIFPCLYCCRQMWLPIHRTKLFTCP